MTKKNFLKLNVSEQELRELYDPGDYVNACYRGNKEMREVNNG